MTSRTPTRPATRPASSNARPSRRPKPGKCCLRAVRTSKIKKGDRVMVLAGKDKGRQGAVLKVLPKDERVVVEGLNMVQRHTRPTQQDPQGGIKNKEASLHLSNVALVDSKGKATRVGFRMDGDKKVRFAKTTGEVVNG